MPWISTFLLSLHNWWNGVGEIKSNLQKAENPLRIGILGAADINYVGIIDPVQTHPGAVVSAIAARDIARAQAQIEQHKLGSTCKAYGSYEELLARGDVDAVYIPLPNGLHCEWAIKAMQAGKHVLIEKAITANADEARQIRDCAAKTNKVAVEAFHWRFHPAAHHVKDIIEGGKYGCPVSIFARMNVPGDALKNDDIRFKYGMGGGACLDLTYVFSACTFLTSPDVFQAKYSVLSTKPRIVKSDPKVDEAMLCDFIIEQPDRPPVHCTVDADLKTPSILGIIPRFWTFSPFLSVELEKAKIDFAPFVIPTYRHTITITEKDPHGKLTGPKHVETCYVDGPQWQKCGEAWWTSYRYQLEAFASAVRARDSAKEYSGPWMTLEESENLMGLIDAVYDKAGLPRRGL